MTSVGNQNLSDLDFIPANIELFKVKNRNCRKKVWNMFKVNNKDTKTTSTTSFWCLYCWLWSDLIHCWFWRSNRLGSFITHNNFACFEKIWITTSRPLGLNRLWYAFIACVHKNNQFNILHLTFPYTVGLCSKSQK